MYRLHVTQAIWTDEKRDDMFDHLYREIELPFPPYIGLVISHEAWSSGPIQRVRWDIGKELFLVDVEDAVPFEADMYDYTAEWLRDHDLNDGWKSHKVHP
jgi:hypothetical protein